MNNQDMFDILFWTLFASMLMTRGWFQFRVWRTGERVLPDQAAKQREGRGARAVEGLFSFLLVALIFYYCFSSDNLQAFKFSAPLWVRWIGISLGITSVRLFAWSHATLGRYWSTALQLRGEHRLITAGPYARIRHPMYTAILGWLASLGLVAGSWIPFIFTALSALNFMLRIPPEEKMMLQQFGDEYRAYMKRTGRLLPA